MKCFGMPCHMQIIFQLHFVRFVCEIHLLCVNLQCVHLYSHLLSQLHVHLHLHLSCILCVCVNHQSSFFSLPRDCFCIHLSTCRHGCMVLSLDAEKWCTGNVGNASSSTSLWTCSDRRFWFCELCADKKLDKYPNTLLRKQRNAHVV